jgi:hypothetical protein
MKQPKFSEKQLDLIGECVLDSIMRLRVARENIGISDARVGIQPTIDHLNEILTILTEAGHEE